MATNNDRVSHSLNGRSMIKMLLTIGLALSCLALAGAQGKEGKEPKSQPEKTCPEKLKDCEKLGSGMARDACEKLVRAQDRVREAAGEPKQCPEPKEPKEPKTKEPKEPKGGKNS